MKYQVSMNMFHGGGMLYNGQSLNVAIRIARKHDCVECGCGGPTIKRSDGACLFNWHATPPFQPANSPFWEVV